MNPLTVEKIKRLFPKGAELMKGEQRMKYMVSLIFLMFTVTACFDAKQVAPSTRFEQQDDRQNHLEDSSERNEEPENSLASDIKETLVQTEHSDLQKLIDEKRAYVPPKEVAAGHFMDMDYLVLVRENPNIFSDGCMPWYEYALLGGPCDTYEKGIDCYNEVNLLYEKWQIDKNFDKWKEWWGEGCMNSYFRRHIVAFSPDAERILLKTCIDPPFGSEALYEIYEKKSYIRSYIYQDIIDPDQVNYTKGLHFATLDPVGYYKDKFTFYEINRLSNYYSVQDALKYEISVTTDSNDLLYYKKDVDPQGNKCIGIYSISDAQLIFQSEAIENYPFLVEIIEKELIAGFSSNFKYGYMDYYKINMETKEADYLFTECGEGSFSPDGKYFAYPDISDGNRGYNIYSVESGENAFIKSYGVQESSPNCPNDNQVYCWVSKDKLETLKGDGRVN